MNALFADRRFAGFGPTQLDPAPAQLHGVVASRTARLREKLREACPKRPGVYGMIDPRGRLIYVGKAKSLRSRLLGYFRPNSRDPKAGRILEAARAIVWEHASNEFAALLRELELIRRWQPSYNVHGQPGRRRVAYVVLGRRPAPALGVMREPSDSALACWGPIMGAKRLTEAVRRLNDAFQLRDCERKQAMHFADQLALFPLVRPAGCLRFEIGTCSGPCAEGVSRSGYGRQVRAARTFLNGRDTMLLPNLDAEMIAAALSMQYERAAVLRDKLESLRWLDERLTWLQQTRKTHSFIYPLGGDDGRTLWYLIRRGKVRAVVEQPRSAATRTAARTALEEIYDAPDRDDVAASDQLDSILLVAAWFKRRPLERARAISLDCAREACAPLVALRA